MVAALTHERRIVLRFLDGLERIEGVWLGELPPLAHPALKAFKHVRTTDRAFYFDEQPAQEELRA